MSSKPSAFPLQIQEEEGRIIARFPANTMLTETNAEDFSRELLALAGQPDRPHLLVDLGGVTMLTSIILAKFIALNNRARAAGGRLTLVNPNPIVHQVFKVSRLDTILEIRQHAEPLPV